MKVRFYVIDRELHVFPCYLLSKCDKDGYQIRARRDASAICSENGESRVLKFDSYQLYLFLNEIDNCPNFKNNLARNIRSIDRSPFVIQLMPNAIEFIDGVW
jgi:hypothetical protein